MDSRSALIIGALLLLPACTQTAQTTTAFTSWKDAATLSSLEGTWTAETPRGVVTVVICEDVEGEEPNGSRQAYAVLGSNTCVVHEVLGGGRSKTEDVDIDNAMAMVDDGTFGGREVACDGVVATPLFATMTLGPCGSYALRGALIYATSNKEDAYAPPFSFDFEVTEIRFERPQGTYDGQTIQLTYNDSLSCLDSGSGLSHEFTVGLRHTTGEGCAARR